MTWSNGVSVIDWSTDGERPRQEDQSRNPLTNATEIDDFFNVFLQVLFSISSMRYRRIISYGNDDDSALLCVTWRGAVFCSTCKRKRKPQQSVASPYAYGFYVGVATASSALYGLQIGYIAVEWCSPHLFQLL